MGKLSKEERDQLDALRAKEEAPDEAPESGSVWENPATGEWGATLTGERLRRFLTAKAPHLYDPETEEVNGAVVSNDPNPPGEAEVRRFAGRRIS